MTDEELAVILVRAEMVAGVNPSATARRLAQDSVLALLREIYRLRLELAIERGDEAGASAASGRLEVFERKAK